MNPMEQFQRGLGLNSIIQLDSRKPLRTSFRSNYPVPLPVEVVDLLRFLKTQDNIPVNERLELVVRKEAIRLAQEYNRKLKETPEKPSENVDSQQRPNQ